MIESFSLYLRAFSSTNRFRESYGQYSFVSSQRFAATGYEDLEFFLQKALAKVRAPNLLALGQPGEHVGAGRAVSTDSTWQADVALLTSGADTIFLVPAPNDGTIWEIQYILSSEFHSKTIFIVPPSVASLGATPEQSDASLRLVEQRIRETTRFNSFSLARDSVYRVHRDGTPGARIEFPQSNIGSWVQGLRALGVGKRTQ